MTINLEENGMLTANTATEAYRLYRMGADPSVAGKPILELITGKDGEKFELPAIFLISREIGRNLLDYLISLATTREDNP